MTSDAQQLRDAIFEHDLFGANMLGNSSYPLDSVRNLKQTWPYERVDVQAALEQMEREGLVEAIRGPGAWSATPAGQLARERRWQARGLRHPILNDPTADLRDVIVALLRSAGSDVELSQGTSLMEQELGTYLSHVDSPVREEAIDALCDAGIARRGAHVMDRNILMITLTVEGCRHYAHVVVPRLGLCPPATILAAPTPEALRFDDLGLDATLVGNLRYRWEEAERCDSAGAWLASATLYGSILEVVLLGWLQRDMSRSMTALGTPRDKQQKAKPLEGWTLSDLITVSTELGYLDAGHARHAQAVRESRNLIHPSKQIRERSTPDGHLAGIAKHVVRAVLEALAQAARKGMST